MADTGAPWNIPYVEPTDIPRTYPDDSEDLALAIAAGLSAAGNPGIGSNVVQTVKTDTFSTTSSTFVDVPDLSASITPSSDDSKVLVILTIFLGNTNTSADRLLLRRNTTSLSLSTSGDATSLLSTWSGNYGADLPNSSGGVTVVFLDDPSTTSSTTYSVQIRRSAGTMRVNLAGAGSYGQVSSITAIEVAA